MADIVLAEAEDRVWLVAGEAHLDDLLANTLPPEVSIELVVCEHAAAVRTLWLRSGGDPSSGMPWLVHPAIVARVRAANRPGGPTHAVLFSPWSALLDPPAQAAIAAAAAAQAGDAAGVTLVDYRDPAGPPALADLSRLRVQLIEAQLMALGLPPDRIRRQQRDATEDADTQRVDIVVGAD
jgi:hypothetical protein